MTPKPSEAVNHYDVLGLNKNCTQKEIKESFIALSKEYHPDKNINNLNAQKEFVKVNQAYSVLSKTVSRREYDHFLQDCSNDAKRVYYHYDDDIYTTRPPGKYEKVRYDQMHRRRTKPGCNGRSSNLFIVLCCAAFTVFGAGVQFLVLRTAISSDLKHKQEENEKNNRMLDFARNQAKENGLEMQIKLMKEDALYKADRRRKLLEEDQQRQQEEKTQTK